MDPHTDAAQVMSAGVTKAGATAAIYGGFTANEIAAFGGLVVACIGLAYNIWHGQRRLKILRNRPERDTED